MALLSWSASTTLQKAYPSRDVSEADWMCHGTCQKATSDHHA